MAPRVHTGDYVWVDRAPARGGEAVVRLLVERDGYRTLRAFDECCPERTVDAGNETDIRGIVVFVGNTV